MTQHKPHTHAHEEKEACQADGEHPDAESAGTPPAGERSAEDEVRSGETGSSGAPLEGSQTARSREPEAEPAATETSEDLAQLREELEQALLRIDQLARHAADQENIRKRAAKDHDHALSVQREAIFRGLLPVVDNFERAIEAMKSTTDAEAIKAGAVQIYQSFGEFLSRQGVKPIPGAGQAYDPHLHEAVMHAPSPDHADGQISLEVEKGYYIGEKVLRHSRVVVSSGAPAAPEPSDEGTSDEEEPD